MDDFFYTHPVSSKTLGQSIRFAYRISQKEQP